jgi:isocitrate lyase
MRSPRRQGARADVAIRRTLAAARLAADVLNVHDGARSRARTRLSATLVTVGRRPLRRAVRHRRAERAEGFFRVRDGLEAAIARGLAYAPYADVVWFETSTPDLGEAREFAQSDPRTPSAQAARLQLLAVVQLAQAPRR